MGTYSICIICCYMPCRGSYSDQDFFEAASDLAEIVKSLGDHHFILVGDFNADLLEKKDTRSVHLSELLKENNISLSPDHPAGPTYSHPNGSSCVDFILFSSSLSSILCSPAAVGCHPYDPANVSHHAYLAAAMPLDTSPAATNLDGLSNDDLPTRFRWDKCDKAEYQKFIDMHIQSIPLPLDCSSIEAYVQTLISLLNVAASETTPAVSSRRSKSCKPWSPVIKEALANNRRALHVWQDAGRPPAGSPEHTIKRQLTKALRASLRQEVASRRDTFIGEINKATSSDQKLFHKLVNSHRKTQASTHRIIRDGIEHEGEDALITVWSEHFSTLATPSVNTMYDEMYSKSTSEVVTLIEDARARKPPIDISISPSEISKAIKSLNSGKSADIYGITAEHLKYASPLLAPFLAKLLSDIVNSGKIPSAFKPGFVTPIHKKGSPADSTDSYRGITVAPLLSKLLEHVVLARSTFEQNKMQFGFTKKKSPILAALLVSEHIAEAKDSGSPLFVTALDVKKAFDVVDHQILKLRLLPVFPEPRIWQVVVGLLTQSTSQVRVNRALGDPYPNLQGVGQGRILSTLQYKVYINPLLELMENIHLSPGFGALPGGTPTCADDIILIAKTHHTHQTQLDAVSNYASKNRYQLHPTKTKTLLYYPNEELQPILLNGHPVPLVDKLTHLGIERHANSASATEVISARIASARATAYSLMGAGLHGINGLNPVAARSILQAYVVPRLLYGLEAIVLTQTQIQLLEVYFRKLLRHIQSLPDNTANPAVYLLIGLPPIEAFLDKNIVSLCEAAFKDTHVREIALRQLSLKNFKSSSWFIYAQKRLGKYDLISPLSCLTENENPTTWAKRSKEIIANFWLENLAEELSNFSSLRFLTPPRDPNRPHTVWCAQKSDYQSTKQSIVKARLLTGTYRLQGNRSAFNQHTSRTCQLCGSCDETRPHFLLHCKALHEVRAPYVEKLTQLLSIDKIYDEDLLRLILDPSSCSHTSSLSTLGVNLHDIEILTQRLTFKLHCRRFNILSTL